MTQLAMLPQQGLAQGTLGDLCTWRPSLVTMWSLGWSVGEGDILGNVEESTTQSTMSGKPGGSPSWRRYGCLIFRVKMLAGWIHDIIGESDAKQVCWTE